jgi:membrane-associated phospholipid phosphatase
MFQLQLGHVAETILSVPGCFFGLPAFAAPGALLIALASDDMPMVPDIPGIFALSLLLGLLLSRWRAILERPDDGAVLYGALFSNTLLVFGSPLLAVVLCSLCDLESGGAFFYLCTWYTSILPVLILKRVTARRRPACCEATTGIKRALPMIPSMMRRDPNASFPSGDVAGAVSFAYPLWYCGAAPKLAVACIALSAFGRMYFHAHHLLDVLVGGLIALFTAVALERGLGACAATAWHPLAALAVVGMIMKLLGPGPFSRPKGRGESSSEA